jgi:hypothetical protein
LNTAPGGKSVIAYGTRLGLKAGLVSAKCKATVDVVLSSFEAELHGVDEGLLNNANIFRISGLMEAFKQNASTRNVLAELSQYPSDRFVFSDNEAMVNFVNGNAKANGMKHATLRYFYVKEQIDRGVELSWMSGKTILANPMTKAVHQAEHEVHCKEVQGLLLVNETETEEQPVEVVDHVIN